MKKIVDVVLEINEKFILPLEDICFKVKKEKCTSSRESNLHCQIQSQVFYPIHQQSHTKIFVSKLVFIKEIELSSSGTDLEPARDFIKRRSGWAIWPNLLI
jgi:hypothetical protein